MQKTKEQQRLLTKYAEEYLHLETKLSFLQKENTDLKANMQINKEIIQKFFQKVAIDDKVTMYIAKLKEENALLSSMLADKEKESQAAKDKYFSFKQGFNALYDELDKAKIRCFQLENIIIEKENTLKHLNRKGKKCNRTDARNEVFIANPSDAIVKLNDKLELYRDINNKLSLHIKTLKVALEKSEHTLLAYEADNSKYKQELTAFKLQKNNNSILAQIGQSLTVNRPHTPHTPKSGINSDVQSILNTSKLNKSANITSDHTRSDYCYHSKSRRSVMKEIEKLEGVNRNRQAIDRFDLTEEWFDTLKNCGLSQEDYIKYCRNKLMGKLTEVIEYLYKLIIDKNVQIRLLTEENEYLNSDNLKLNRMNIELSEEIEMIKGFDGNKSQVERSHQRHKTDNSTFVNVDDNCIEEENNVIDNCNDFCFKVKQSISSSEFREAMVLDRFDLASELSKKVDYCDSNANCDHIKLF